MLIKQLESLQDLLGDLHDAQMLIHEIVIARKQWRGVAQEIRGLTALVNQLSKFNQQTFAKLEADWLDGHSKDFFTTLHDIAKIC